MIRVIQDPPETHSETPSDPQGCDCLWWCRPGTDFGQADLGIPGNHNGLTSKSPKNGDAVAHKTREDGPFEYQISTAPDDGDVRGDGRRTTPPIVHYGWRSSISSQLHL
uniref:Uncharacterized protein n=1 Tax=Angiostrongylus cantonensis TaxID=6313 RepID=A0A0K0D5C2_ANGCA